MQVQDLRLFEGASKTSKEIYFKLGLPAFESFKEFFIVSNEDEAPFLWLQSKQQASLAFVTIDPFLVLPDYLPDLSEEDVRFLEIEDEEDVLLLSIVNVAQPGMQQVSANLLSPVVINWKRQLGKQVIVQNHQRYSVKTKFS